MKHYIGFEELINNKEHFPEDGMIYKSKPKSDISNAQFWVLSESEVNERKPYLMLPISIENTDAEKWFDISLFSYLINEKSFNPEFNIKKTDFFLDVIIQYITTDQFN